MAVRSRVFAQVTTSTVGTATVYTCPADRTALVKSYVICERAGAAAVFSVLFRSSVGASNIDSYLFRNVALPAYGTWVCPVDIVLSDVNSIRQAHESGGALATYMAGSLLLGDPE